MQPSVSCTELRRPEETGVISWEPIAYPLSISGTYG
jgi:hypothetical protein